MDETPGSEPRPSPAERFNALGTAQRLVALGVAVGALAIASLFIMAVGNNTPMPSGAWYNKPIVLMNCQELGAYHAATIKPNLQRGSSFEDEARASRQVALLNDRADAIGGCSGSENW